MPPVRNRAFLGAHPRDLWSASPGPSTPREQQAAAPTRDSLVPEGAATPAAGWARPALLSAPPPQGHGCRTAERPKARDLEAAWRCYLAARGDGRAQSPDLVGRYLRLLLEQGPAWPQIHLLLQMEQAAGLPLPQSIFRQALDRATRSGDVALARQLCQSRSGRPATHDDYEMMLRGVAGSHPQQAWALLMDMVQHHLSPTLEAYRIILAGRVGAGALSEAEEVLDLIEAADLRPAAGVYSCLIHAYARVGRLTRAHALLMRMQVRGVPPCRLPYNVTIAACAREGQLRQALEIYEEMLAAGLRPNRSSLWPLLRAAATANEAPLHAALMSQARAHQLYF